MIYMIAYFWLILLFSQSMYIHINYIVFLVNYVSVLICCYNKIKKFNLDLFRMYTDDDICN